MAVVAAGDGFSTSARHRIDDALARAKALTGIRFSVIVATSQGDSRVYAESLLARKSSTCSPSVLVFVSPDQRLLEIVTNSEAHHRVTDESCALAVLSMTTSFTVGDLVGGIVTGIRMLGESARPAVSV